MPRCPLDPGRRADPGGQAPRTPGGATGLGGGVCGGRPGYGPRGEGAPPGGSGHRRGRGDSEGARGWADPLALLPEDRLLAAPTLHEATAALEAQSIVGNGSLAMALPRLMVASIASDP